MLMPMGPGTVFGHGRKTPSNAVALGLGLPQDGGLIGKSRNSKNGQWSQLRKLLVKFRQNPTVQ
jgi:hypothetical protein